MVAGEGATLTSTCSTGAEPPRWPDSSAGCAAGEGGVSPRQPSPGMLLGTSGTTQQTWAPEHPHPAQGWGKSLAQAGPQQHLPAEPGPSHPETANASGWEGAVGLLPCQPHQCSRGPCPAAPRPPHSQHFRRVALVGKRIWPCLLPQEGLSRRQGAPRDPTLQPG